MRRKRKRIAHQPAADDLVHRVVAPDILRHVDQLAIMREQAGGVQAARFVENRLPLSKMGRHLPNRGRGNPPRGAERRNVRRQRFDGASPAEAARGIRGHIPAAVDDARNAISQFWRQRHVHDVVIVAALPFDRLAIRAVLDRAQLVGIPDHPLRKQKTGSQLPIGARRSHDHGERLTVQPDLEWLLGGGPIGRARRLAVLHSDNRYVAPWRRFCRHRSRAVVRTHAVGEALARVSVVELALVHDRQLGHPGCQHRGEQARTFETAARRIGLEHIAIEIGARELLDPALGVSLQDVGQVAFRRGRHQRRAAVCIVDQLHRFARGAKACLDLGAHRHPFHLRSKDIDEPRVTLVPAVVAHRFAEQTRGDADARPIAHAMILSMPKRKDAGSLGRMFETLSSNVTRWTGSTPRLRLCLRRHRRLGDRSGRSFTSRTRGSWSSTPARPSSRS